MKIKEFDPNVFKNKSVLFICTKNTDYIRISQELNIIKEYAASVTVVGSNKGSYKKRLPEVLAKLRHVKTSDYDILFISFMAQMIVPFLIRKKNRLLIVDFFISVYDTLVNDRKAVKGPLALLLKYIDKRTLEKADMVIADTKEHAKYFYKMFHCPERKISVLYLKADPDIYYPQIVEKPQVWKDKFVVFYFGSILPIQGIEVILDAAELLKDEKRIVFLIIGPISNRLCLPNVRSIDWVEQAKLAKYIAMSDLCLAGHFNADIKKAKRTIPGKAYIYQAMHKRMILGENPANREFICEDPDNIYYVEMGSSKKLADLIREIYQQTQQ